MVNLIEAATSGIGVYSISEAARYAKIHQSTLTQWFFGTSKRPPLRGAEIQCNDFKGISFLDFVEAVAIRSLRVDHKVSLQKIREALETAKAKYSINNPFAHQNHRTVIDTAKNLHIYFGDDPQNPVQITGKNTGQKSFERCVEAYMQNLKFDENGIAKLYEAYEFKGEKIILNPKFNFGEPSIAGNAYTAETLYRAVIAEGSFERAAKLYDVSEEITEAAYRYWNSEIGVAA